MNTNMDYEELRNSMTVQDAAEVLRNTRCFGTMDIAKNVILKALEAQPSEDCISRKAVLDGLANIAKAKAKSDAQKSLMGRVMFFTEHLPSVAPQPNERTETHECDLEQIIKSTIKEYLDKDYDDNVELLLSLSKDLCERIRKEC